MDWKSAWTGLVAMNWTRILAIWGAMLSTVLGGVQVLQWRERRRGRIVVIVRNFTCVDSNGQPARGGALVCFEAVNDAAKPVMIDGLQLRVAKHEIDLTPYSGTPNLTVISEGEEFSRGILREVLLRTVRESTRQRPPYRCVARFHTRAGRWHSKSFTLDSEGVHA